MTTKFKKGQRVRAVKNEEVGSGHNLFVKYLSEPLKVIRLFDNMGGIEQWLVKVISTGKEVVYPQFLLRKIK